MTVYTVERCWAYEGCDVEAVFSTREKAEAYAAHRSTTSSADYDVKEFEVDEQALPSESAATKEESR